VTFSLYRLWFVILLADIWHINLSIVVVVVVVVLIFLDIECFCRQTGAEWYEASLDMGSDTTQRARWCCSSCCSERLPRLWRQCGTTLCWHVRQPQHQRYSVHLLTMPSITVSLTLYNHQLCCNHRIPLLLCLRSATLISWFYVYGITLLVNSQYLVSFHRFPVHSPVVWGVTTHNELGQPLQKAGWSGYCLLVSVHKTVYQYMNKL